MTVATTTERRRWNRRLWQRDSLGTGITRTTGPDGLVTVRRDWDGTTTVTVRRAQVFATNPETGESSYVYMIAHKRTFGGAP
jgi:hypothetical protein